MISFLGKRVIFLAAIIAIAAIIITERGGIIAVGVLTGAAASIGKVKVFSYALGSQESWRFKPLAASVVSQTASFLLLLIAVLADIRLFAGVAAGFVIMPAVICVNVITERAGLTRNSWNDTNTKFL